MKRTYFSILFTALLVAACSSNTTLGEQGGADETPQEAMRFSAPTVGSMDTRASSTTKALETGFLVSAYKNGGGQVVMDQYEAAYSKDNWNNNSKWETVSGSSKDLYQEQYEKYWDLSAFPYEFIAIAPAPISDKKIIDGFSVKRSSLTLKTLFLISQSATDGTVTPQQAEKEYLLAQTERTYTDGTRTDTDKLTGSAIGTTSSNATEKVPLPFHHLSTKVRFGIYTTEHISASQHVAIKDVTFTVKSKDKSGIVKKIGSYSVDLTKEGVSSALDGTFSGEERETGDKTLLTFSGPTTDKYTDAYLENHEWNSKSDVNAYYFECPDGLLQVPQSGVQIYVSLTLETKTGEDVTYGKQEFQITNADGSTTSEFTWLPNRFYTYYIVVKRLLSHDISFTATVSDWENVTGEIETNMEE